MLKVVLDTNIFVAAFLSKTQFGYASQIISAWQAGAFTLVISQDILREIIATLYEKNIPEKSLEDLVAIIGEIAFHVPGAYETNRLDKIDADDNKFLAAALESRADYLVSVDNKSLLPMKYFHGTQIVRPELFLRQITLVEHEGQI